MKIVNQIKININEDNKSYHSDNEESEYFNCPEIGAIRDDETAEKVQTMILDKKRAEEKRQGCLR